MENVNDDLPHGIRCNNPGNLRGVPQFQGSSRGRDGFLIFDCEVNGVRAAAVTLHTYYVEHGLKTIYAIIKRWAPPASNDTDAYADYVGECMGLSPEQVRTLDVHVDCAWLCIKFLDAMFTFENGKPPMQWHSWPSWYCTRTYAEALLKADFWKDV